MTTYVLNDPVAKIVRQLLIDLGIVTMPPSSSNTSYGSWPCFADSFPDKPDKCVAVYGQDGFKQGRVQYTGRTVMKPGLQVLVRSLPQDPDNAFIKSRRITQAFDEEVNLNTVTLNGNVYKVQAIHRQGDPFPIGEESGFSERSVFSVNAIVTVYPVSLESDTGTGT